MKNKKIIISIVLSIIPLTVLFFNLLDIYDVLVGNGGYPFGSDFFLPYSIYRTRPIYIFYVFFFTIVLVLAIYFAFKRKWKFYILFLLIGGVFFIYPIYYNT